MKLPFLKNKRNRMAEHRDPMSIGLSDLEEHCAGELMDAIGSKDIKAFRSAIEALVSNCFEEERQENDGK